MDSDRKIILENSSDLYKLPMHVLKNTKIYNFKGKYFDKIYEEALKIERSGGKVDDFIKKKIGITNIELEIQFNTNFGQKLIACGSSNSLGSWDYKQGSLMIWNPGNIWKTNIPVLDYFEFKLVLLENEKVKKWESGNNRIFNLEHIINLLEKENISGIKEIIVIKENDMTYTYDEKNSILNVKCKWNE